MTNKEAQKIIGTKGSIVVGGLVVNVRVLDYKNSYGNDRWLVTPLSGAQEIWTEQSPISTG